MFPRDNWWIQRNENWQMSNNSADKFYNTIPECSFVCKKQITTLQWGSIRLLFLDSFSSDTSSSACILTMVLKDRLLNTRRTWCHSSSQELLSVVFGDESYFCSSSLWKQDACVETVQWEQSCHVCPGVPCGTDRYYHNTRNCELQKKVNSSWESWLLNGATVCWICGKTTSIAISLHHSEPLSPKGWCMATYHTWASKQCKGNLLSFPWPHAHCISYTVKRWYRTG